MRVSTALTQSVANGCVYLIDDEQAVRDSVAQWLELAGINVTTFACGREVVNTLTAGFSGVIVADLRMPGFDGMEVLRAVQSVDPDIPTLLITGHGDITTAVKAMQSGAYDFVEKPFDPERLTNAIQRALRNRAQLLEVRKLKARVATDAGLEHRLLGDCAAIRQIRQQVTDLAEIDVSVLLVGETGTGKEVIARCLHDISSRNGSPFSVIDCGAIPSDSVERELFGEAGGVERASPFELASGGTLLLDELGNMPPEQQVKLLRLLEAREVKRVGGHQTHSFDVRLVSAVDETLYKSLEDGHFRKELYFRLNTIEIKVPPLREREDDVVLLFHHFVERAAHYYGRELPDVKVHDLAVLKQHHWPGNVRELESAAERFVLNAGAAIEQFMPEMSPTQPVDSNARKLTDAVNAFEKSLLLQAWRQAEGDVSITADLPGLPRRTLSDKLQRHEMNRSDFKSS